MHGLPIDEKAYYNGKWIDSCLPQLLALPKIRRREENGARLAADFIHDKMP